MDALNPRQRGTLVEALGSAVFHGGAAIGDVPALLKRVLETGAWREFETPTHEVIRYDRFEAFITTPPTRGLGATPELIERIIQDDAEALLLYREAMKTGQGARTDLAPNIHSNIRDVSYGTTKQYALERLQRERPDLYEEVSVGKRSAHGAMVEAGFLPRMVGMPVDDMSRLADALKRHLTPEQLVTLRAALSAHGGPAGVLSAADEAKELAETHPETITVERVGIVPANGQMWVAWSNRSIRLPADCFAQVGDCVTLYWRLPSREGRIIAVRVNDAPAVFFGSER